MNNSYPFEIEKLLKLGKEPEAKASPIEEVAAPAVPDLGAVVVSADDLLPGEAPGNLPMVDFEIEWTKPMADQVMEAIIGNQTIKPKAKHLNLNQLPIPVKDTAAPKKPSKVFSFGWIKSIMNYSILFVISFAFFYVLFNFSSLTSQVSAWFDKPQNEQELQAELAPYYKWMNGYYFSVTNQDMLDPNNDIDKDGLSNLDEYKIRTNPTIADSDDDGSADGIEVINSTNPWGQGNMSDAQKKIRESLDIILINNRISYNSVSVADHVKESDSDKFDLSKPGQLSIPKLKLQVPLIWSPDPSSFDADLTKGVVHYPGTALPGGMGTMYVSGHSSDYIWKSHPYKTVFARINTLSPGDDIFVTVYGFSGESYTFRYQVTAENIYKPDDQAQFNDNSAAIINLSTCWPIGTQRDRYVVTGTLVPL